MEMMIVVCIIALVVGVSVPSITAGLDSVRMVSAADSVAAFLNAAVNRSQRREEPVEIVIDLKSARLTSYASDTTRELTLPDGIGIEAVLTGEEKPEEPLYRIVLLPGGVVPGFGVQLLSRRGARRIVHLDPMTGYPRVESVKPS